MSVLVARDVRQLIGTAGGRVVSPFLERSRHDSSGTSYGLSFCGYDVRLDQDICLEPGEFSLGSTMEMFDMPNFVVGIVHDKSTWARRGLAVQNTVIEPGWRGFLTLELTNHGRQPLRLHQGCGVAQILFHHLSGPAEVYDGKYQDQERGPQEARS